MVRPIDLRQLDWMGGFRFEAGQSGRRAKA